MLDFAAGRDLLDRLERTLEADALAHFYIISGPEGSGKTTLATLLAAAMECTGEGRPCMACNQCRKVQKNIHPDVSYVTSDKVNIGVEPVQRMRADAFIRPGEGRRRIFIIPRADALSEQAQNIMLKLLEEPPGTAAFFLLTENPGRLLETIRSRAQQIQLSPLEGQLLRPLLQRRFPTAEPNAIERAISACGGLPGRAMDILSGAAEQKENLPKQRAAELVEHITQEDKLQIAALLTGLERWGRVDFESFLTYLIDLCASRARSGHAALLVPAAGLARTALDYHRGNVSTAHICGYLTSGLTR